MIRLRQVTLASAAAAVALASGVVWAPAASAALPGAPTSVRTESGNGTVTVSWAAVTSTPATTRYIVSAFLGATGIAGCTTTTGTSCVVTGLTNGTTYNFYVQAQSFDGTGPASATVTAMPYTRPGQPTGITVTPENRALTIAWTAPTSTGGVPIQFYQVIVSSEPQAGLIYATRAVAPPGTSVTVSGLTPGRTHYVSIMAVTENQSSELTAAVSGVPTGPPGLPTGVTVTPGNKSLTIAWSPPASDGGTPIVTYVVIVSSEPQAGQIYSTRAVAPPGTSVTVTGLVNGRTHYVSLFAVTQDNGSSELTAAISGIPTASSSDSGAGSSGSGGGSGASGNSGSGTSGAGAGSGSGSSSGATPDAGSPAVAKPPTISSAAPGRGPVKGGTVITIRGTNLTGTTKVTVGGVRATRVSVVNATTIKVTTPKGKAGKRAVSVTTPAGTATRADAFTYLG